MSFEIQQKIKQNALEIREYVSDLYDWQKEMELREKTKAELKKSERAKGQPAKKTQESDIRQVKVDQPAKGSEKEQEKRKDLTRDVNTVGEYYKAWDKFDAEKELARLEQEEQRAYRPYNPYEDSKNILRAKPKAKMNISGRRTQVTDPTELKDKGNLHFQSLQYEKAINCYTECLKKLQEEGTAFEDLTEEKKKLRCVVLSNRSMAYLKIQETIKALNDATESLVFNGQYSKSYYRRAECYKKLGKYKESLRDFHMVRKLEPGQAKAEAEIKKIQAFLAKRSRELRESMVVPYNEALLHGGRRVEIEQVNEFPLSPSAAPTNYLQQL